MIFVRRAGLALQVALEVELRVEAVRPPGEKGPLHQAIGVGRPGRERMAISRATPIS